MLFCDDLHTFAWRNCLPKIVPREKNDKYQVCSEDFCLYVYVRSALAENQSQPACHGIRVLSGHLGPWMTASHDASNGKRSFSFSSFKTLSTFSDPTPLFSRDSCFQTISKFSDPTRPCCIQGSYLSCFLTILERLEGLKAGRLEGGKNIYL